MNADGATITRVTRVPGFYSSLVWSPDSKHLLYAYASDSLSLTDLYAMNTDGSQHVRLTGSPSEIDSSLPTSWSPDGTKVLFERVYSTDGHLGKTTITIWVMNADGSGQTPLSLQTQVEGDVVWQP
jgi:Tol biopolymer transport system component